MFGSELFEVDEYLRLDREDEDARLGDLLTRGRFLAGAGAVAGGVMLGGAPAAAGRLATPKRGGIVTFGTSSASANDSLDPARNSRNSEFMLTNLVFDGLATFDYGTWKVHPALATGWKSNADATQWTFALRKGVKFSDGTPFTAADVDWTLRRVLNKAVGSNLYARLSPELDPSGIQIIDPYTIRLHLTQPDAVLPLALANRAVFIVKNGTTSFTPATQIGTGPFILGSWTAGQKWEVTRNPNYWAKGLPYLDGVRMVGFTDQTTLSQAVVTGAIDAAVNVDFTALDAAKGSKNLQLIRLRNGSDQEIDLDQSQAPFKDGRVVLAIKYAVDRQKILQTVYRGLGSVTYDVPEPTSDPFYPPGLSRAHSIKRAKQLLAAAGYPDGIDLELFTTDGQPHFVDLAVAFANVVQPAGIRVKVTQQPPTLFFSQSYRIKPMFVNNWLRRFPTEICTTIFTSTAPFNSSHYKSPVLDRLVAQAIGTVNETKQRQLIQKAFRKISNEIGTIIPVMIDQLALCSKQYSGFVYNSNVALDLRNVHRT